MKTLGKSHQVCIFN